MDLRPEVADRCIWMLVCCGAIVAVIVAVTS
jgi:hypothetical protein